MTLRLIPHPPGLRRRRAGLPLAAQAQQYWHASCAYDAPSPLATGGFYDGESDAVSGCIRSISEGRAAVLLPSALRSIKRVPTDTCCADMPGLPGRPGPPRGQADLRPGRRFPSRAGRRAVARQGYIDARGRMAIAPRFDEVSDFVEAGLAIVTLDGKRQIIDRQGKPTGDALDASVDNAQLSDGLPARLIVRYRPEYQAPDGTRRYDEPGRRITGAYGRTADRRHRARRIRALERQVGMGGRTALRGNHGPVRLDAGRRPGPRGSRAAGRQGRGHRCRQGLSQPGADGRLLAGRVAARQLRAAGREGPAPGQHRRTPIAPHRTNRQGAAVHERRHREAVGAWQDRGGDAGQGSGHAAPDARLCVVPERSAPAARPADARRRLGRRRRPARHRRPDRWLRRSPRPSVAARRRRQAAGRVQSRWQAGAGRRRAGSAERAAHARLAPRRTGRWPC